MVFHSVSPTDELLTTYVVASLYPLLARLTGYSVFASVCVWAADDITLVMVMTPVC